MNLDKILLPFLLPAVSRQKKTGKSFYSRSTASGTPEARAQKVRDMPDGTLHPYAMLRSGYITGYTEESAMSTTPQKRALNRYRKRLKQRGMARFEVLGLDADRELIRSLARRLAGDGPDSARIRATVRLTISGEQSKKGGILNALRRSPLVGADLDLSRPLTPGRRVDL
jgi:hypothetical protein